MLHEYIYIPRWTDSIMAHSAANRIVFFSVATLWKVANSACIEHHWLHCLMCNGFPMICTNLTHPETIGINMFLNTKQNFIIVWYVEVFYKTSTWSWRKGEYIYSVDVIFKNKNERIRFNSSLQIYITIFFHNVYNYFSSVCKYLIKWTKSQWIMMLVIVANFVKAIFSYHYKLIFIHHWRNYTTDFSPSNLACKW